MPEIAEVRTVRDALKKTLIGKTIINVNVISRVCTLPWKNAIIPIVR